MAEVEHEPVTEHVEPASRPATAHSGLSTASSAGGLTTSRAAIGDNPPFLDFLAATDVDRRAELVLNMQRSSGNRAVAQMLQRGTTPVRGSPSRTPDVDGHRDDRASQARPQAEAATAATGAVLDPVASRPIKRTEPVVPPDPAAKTLTIALQRSAGNQAVLRAMRSSSNGQIQREPASPPAPPAAPPVPAPPGPAAGAAPPGPAPAPPGPGGAAPARPAGSVDPALSFIADYARKVPGYTLVAHAVGADPITGQPVPGSLVKEIVALIPGGAALMERLEQSGVLPKASAWLSDEIGKLGLTFDTIAGLFKQAWDSISAWDLFDPAAAWARLSKIFDPPIAKVTVFAERAAEKLFEFSLEAMLAAGGGAASQVMGVLKRAGQAFGQIVKDPIGFASNLVAAVKGGFAAFASNIGTHLQKGLLGWLTGALKGAITLPQKLDFEGIISLALQALGLTWDRIRQRLVKMVGEKTVAMAERAVSFVKDIADRGLGVVWEKIAEFAGNLADTVIGGIRDWVAESVVGAAIKRLVTMFNPAGAIINAVLAVYNTIEFVIERAKQLGDLIDAVSTSISEIASGAIGRAVNAVENALSRAVPVAIGFLAQLLGLDGIGDKIREVIENVRGAVDNAIDKVINWIVSKVKGGGKEAEEPAPAAATETPGAAEKPLEFDAANDHHSLWVDAEKPSPEVFVASWPPKRVRDLLAHWGTLVNQLPPDQKTPAGTRLQKALALVETEETERKQALKAQDVPETDRRGPMGKLKDFMEDLFGRFAALDPSRPQGKRSDEQKEADRDSRKAAFTCSARITLSESAGKAGWERMPRGSRKSGGDVTRTDGDTITTRSWSTGDALKSEANTSHGERHLYDWLKGETAEFRDKVVAIELHNDPFTPCGACTDILTDLLKLLPNAKVATLTWTEPYYPKAGPNSPSATRPYHFQKLTAAGWIVSPDFGRFESEYRKIQGDWAGQRG